MKTKSEHHLLHVVLFIYYAVQGGYNFCQPVDETLKCDSLDNEICEWQYIPVL